MTSKRAVWFASVLSLIGFSAAAESPEQFVQTIFGELPAEQKIRLSGEVEEGVRAAYGGRYPGISVSYWTKNGLRIWALKASGKHGFVHTGAVIRNGRVVQMKVLSSKEQRGRMIETSRFLNQFIGAGLNQQAELDRRIDGISGATYSVNTVRKTARLALFLDSLCGAPPD